MREREKEKRGHGHPPLLVTNQWRTAAVRRLLGEEVVAHGELQVALERLVVDVVLDARLLLSEAVLDLLDLGVVDRRGHLGIQLRLERPLRLAHQLGARVAPRGKLGGRDRDLRSAEVADLDLRP